MVKLYLIFELNSSYSPFMEVPVIYVNNNHTTKDLYGAVGELNESSMRVVDKYMGLVKEADDTTVGVNAEPWLQRLMSEDYLPFKIRRSWHRSEERVLNVLKHELKMQRVSTRRVDMQLEERLEQVEEFKTIYEALVFWGCAFERLNFLSTERARDRLGLISLAVYNFAESRIIRHAARGVYLTRPEFS